MFKSNLYEADLEARRNLSRWAERPHQAAQLTELECDALQPETDEPHRVGLDQATTDELDPEELVALFDREPLVFDWDALDAGLEQAVPSGL